MAVKVSFRRRLYRCGVKFTSPRSLRRCANKKLHRPPTDNQDRQGFDKASKIDARPAYFKLESAVFMRCNASFKSFSEAA